MLPRPEIERRLASPKGPFKPYAFSDPGEVSPMAHFGGPHILRYTTSMHDQTGNLTKDREKIQNMMEHLEAKILDHVDEIADVDVDRAGGEKVAFLSYGSSARSAARAAEIARGEGRGVSVVSVRSLWPMPEERIREALEGVETIVVAERNLGEYIREIRRILPDRDVRLARRMDGRLIPPKLILETAGWA
jgi:2-oxoglutarate ferredoxin oxidoreductase subunit alpha